MKGREFFAGMKAGIPVCIGYFSVSVGFGAMAIVQGLTIWQAILISASNLTSAGQFAGLTVIAAGAAIIEMILMQVVINSRYALMSLALGQRLGPDVGIGKRLLAVFFNTDEVFALGMSRGKQLTTGFFVGVGVVAALRAHSVFDGDDLPGDSFRCGAYDKRCAGAGNCGAVGVEEEKLNCCGRCKLRSGVFSRTVYKISIEQRKTPRIRI